MPETKVVANVVADIHFDLFENLTPTEDSSLLTRRIEEIGDAFLFVAKEAAKNGAPILVLGDLFHKRVMRNDKINIFVKEILQKSIQEIGVKSIIIVEGNHDQLTINGEVSSLQLFTSIPNVHIISSPTISYLGGSKVPFVLIPFREPADFRKALLSVVESKEFMSMKTLEIPMVLGTHLGVNGAKVSGFERGGTEVIELGELLPDVFSYVLLGHYHLHQTLRSGVQYIGSLVPHSFKDLDNNRGYVELYQDCKTGKLGTEFIRVDSKKFYSLSFEEYKAFKDSKEDCYIRIQGVPKKDKDLLSDRRVKTIETIKEISYDGVESISLDLSIEKMIAEYVNTACSDMRKRRGLVKLGKELLNGN